MEKGKGEDLMFKRFTWLTCAVLLCALLISLPAGQVAVASEPAVARIGDKTYPTLAAAVDAVPKDTPNYHNFAGRYNGKRS